jgi:hypothetical protein
VCNLNIRDSRNKDTCDELDEAPLGYMDAFKKSVVKRFEETQEEKSVLVNTSSNTADNAKEDGKSQPEVNHGKLYNTTLSQAAKLEVISNICRQTCTELGMHKDTDFHDVNVLPAVVQDLRNELSSVLRARIREHQMQEPGHERVENHMQLYEHTHRLAEIKGGSETFELILELEREERVLKQVLMQQVMARVCM